MKAFALLMLLTLGCFVSGCATSTVESRRTERFAAYESLPAEQKELVDKGQIKVGMGEDAVYIAWGPPSQITYGENQDGRTSIWLYQGTWMQESRYWNYRVVNSGKGRYMERYLDYDYEPRSYLRAEIVFSKGVVSSWRTQPAPVW